MRISTPVLFLASATLGCASRPAKNDLTSPVNCPYRVLATVSNPQPYNYDVYYQDASRPATVIGEVTHGSTVTFQLPGEGRGRVYLRRPPSDMGTPNANTSGRPLPETRIRIHCAGT